jgi:hypothetical protein
LAIRTFASSNTAASFGSLGGGGNSGAPALQRTQTLIIKAIKAARGINIVWISAVMFLVLIESIRAKAEWHAEPSESVTQFSIL